MKERDDTVYLKHILDAIARIEEYISGVEQETFSKTLLLQDGVIRQVEIIGEAAKRVSSNLPKERRKAPTFMYRDIRRLEESCIN